MLKNLKNRSLSTPVRKEVFSFRMREDNSSLPPWCDNEFPHEGDKDFNFLNNFFNFIFSGLIDTSQWNTKQAVE